MVKRTRAEADAAAAGGSGGGAKRAGGGASKARSASTSGGGGARAAAASAKVSAAAAGGGGRKRGGTTSPSRAGGAGGKAGGAAGKGGGSRRARPRAAEFEAAIALAAGGKLPTTASGAGRLVTVSSTARPVADAEAGGKARPPSRGRVSAADAAAAAYAGATSAAAAATLEAAEQSYGIPQAVAFLCSAPLRAACHPAKAPTPSPGHDSSPTSGGGGRGRGGGGEGADARAQPPSDGAWEPELATTLLQALCAQELEVLRDVVAARAGDVADSHARAAELDALRQDATARVWAAASQDVATAAAEAAAAAVVAAPDANASEDDVTEAVRAKLAEWGAPSLLSADTYDAIDAAVGAARSGAGGRSGRRAGAAVSGDDDVVMGGTAEAVVHASEPSAAAEAPAPAPAAESSPRAFVVAAPSESSGSVPAYHGRPIKGYTHGALYLSAEYETGFPPRKRDSWRYCVPKPRPGDGAAGLSEASVSYGMSILEPKVIEEAREALKAPAFPDRGFPQNRESAGSALTRALALAASFDDAAAEEARLAALHARALAAVVSHPVCHAGMDDKLSLRR